MSHDPLLEELDTLIGQIDESNVHDVAEQKANLLALAELVRELLLRERRHR